LQNGKGRTYLVWCAWRRRRSCGWLVHWLGNASFFRSVLLRFLSWSWFLFSLGSLSKILDLFSSCSVFIFFSVCPSSSSQFVLPDSPSSSVYFFLCSFPCSSSVCSGSGATRDKAGARALAGQCFSLFLSRLLLQSSPGFFLRSSPSCFCVFLVLSLLFLEAGIEERWSRWWCGGLVLSEFFFYAPPPSFSWPSLAYIKPGNGFCSCIRASRSWGTFISVFLRRNGGASVL